MKKWLKEFFCREWATFPDGHMEYSCPWQYFLISMNLDRNAYWRRCLKFWRAKVFHPEQFTGVKTKSRWLPDVM